MSLDHNAIGSEHLDIASTLLEIAGLQVQSEMQGKSMLPPAKRKANVS
jgi:hypothetical protein